MPGKPGIPIKESMYILLAQYSTAIGQAYTQVRPSRDAGWPFYFTHFLFSLLNA
jgi:hypothetical protein